MSTEPHLPSSDGARQPRRRRDKPADPPPPAADAAPADDAIAQLADAKRELDVLRAQLDDSRRLATIGTIAAVIAHEFNNLLTPVVSYAQFALRSAESDAPDLPLIRKALTKAFQGSSKAGRICGSMLGLARGQSNPEVVEVRRLVDEALMVLARDPKKDGIALRVQVPPGLVVRGDAVQLEQVLLNLLINARHAMIGRGGSLTVTAAATPAGEVCVRVIDTGPGIPEAVIGRIFEPFFTTKPTAKPSGEAEEEGGEVVRGSGLGLAICKEIVDHHGGRIEVTSLPRRGTTFAVYLPPVGADAALPASLAA